MSAIKLSILILALCSAGMANAEDPLTAQVDATLRQLNDDGDFSGAVVVMRKGKFIYRQGFGLADVEPAIAITPQTPMDGGSMAKPFTAAAILMLVDEGRVGLDESVRPYVPEFPHTDTTVRQLLNHSAGLPDYDYFQTMLDAGTPVYNIDLVRSLSARGTAPAFKPGFAFAYCNLCYDTLAQVIERASGVSYSDFIRSRFLTPARDGDTFVRPARFADWPVVRIKGYRRVDGRWQPNDVFDNEGSHGASNIYFSADDLAVLMSEWANPKGRIGKIRSMGIEPALIAGGLSGIRLGSWYCDKKGVRCYYSGHHQGFHSFGYWDAKRHIAVAFTSNNTIDSSLQFGLPRLLISLAEGGPLAALYRAPVKTDSDWTQLAGTYRVDGIGRVTISRDREWATILAPNGVRNRIYAVGQGWFYVPGLDVYLARPATPSGQIDLQWHSVFRQSTGKKPTDRARLLSNFGNGAVNSPTF